MPESASFSMRSKPNFRRRRTVLVLVLIVVGVVIAVLVSRGGGGHTAGGIPIPTFHFTATTRQVTQGRRPGPGAAQGEASGIVKMFDDFYQEAFVDPTKWGDGQFPDLRAMFSREAQASFAKDLPSLTIGEARTELQRVDPAPSALVVTVYFDAPGRPAFAVAAATFNASGTPNQKGPKLLIAQKATFYMQKVGSAWTITAYDASQSQGTPSPSPSARPSR